MKRYKPSGEEKPFHCIQSQRDGIQQGEKSAEGNGCEGDAGGKGGAMALMEAMSHLQLTGISSAIGPVGVEETVGGVDDPHGKGHGEDGGMGEMYTGYAGNEPGPQSCNTGRVQREQVPKSERTSSADGSRDLCGGGHRLIVGGGRCVGQYSTA